MKRSLSVIILLIITGIPFFLSVLFIGRQQYVRHQMKEQLENENLISLTIPAGNLHWYKAGKELLIDGQFFDVKSIHEVEGEGYRVTGLYDHHEKQLHEMLGNSLRDKPGNETPPFLIVKLFLSFNAILQEEYPIPDFALQLKNNFSYYTCSFPPWFIPVFSPPPQLAC